MRILGTLAAMVFAIFLTSAHAQTERHAVDNQTESERQQSGSQQSAQPPALPVRIVNDPSQTDSAERQQQEAAEREKQDLVAQQSVATSTEKLVDLTRRGWILAIIQTTVAAAGTVAVVVTIALNRQATNAAVRAAIAADRAAIAAEKALKTERAWMVDNGMGTTSLLNSNVTIPNMNGPPSIYKNGFRVQINWINSGRTPAIRASHVCGRQTFRVGQEIPEIIAPDPGDDSAVIGPGREVHSAIYFGFDEIENARKNGVRHFIYSIMKYKAIDDDEWRISESLTEIEVEGHEDHDGVMWPVLAYKSFGPQNRVT